MLQRQIADTAHGDDSISVARPGRATAVRLRAARRRTSTLTAVPVGPASEASRSWCRANTPDRQESGDGSASDDGPAAYNNEILSSARDTSHDPFTFVLVILV